MQKHSDFVPIHKILIPFVHEGPGMHALELARHFDAEIVLVGVVVVPPEQSLSTAAPAVRALRKRLRHYGKDERITSKSQIIVSYQPWMELVKFLQDEKPASQYLQIKSIFPSSYALATFFPSGE